MPASNRKLTAAMEACFGDLRSIRASGGGTHERPRCPLPVNLLNAAGPSLRPRTSRHRTVRCEAAAEWQAETGPDSRGGCGGGQAGPRRRLAHRRQRPGEDGQGNPAKPETFRLAGSAAGFEPFRQERTERTW